ncbi:hypothetical protein QTG54_013528 [Skeletonema marinoi]|uniref:Protein xylosyltransferase n=1 Tax=Skeletonema marinoi TaxID=267567 RepID=A0AAD9D6L5_9STRA|nr:hypothetical protein QTG54_013528 [Skeletonema marinoi]
MRSLGLRLLAVGVVASICHLSLYFSFASGGESSSNSSNSNPGAVEVKGKDPNGIIDTAIIITSSWIPSHPSTLMVEMVVHSIDLMITSLHPSTPIFITIDQFRLDGDIEQIQNRSNSLDQHVLNLYNIYLINPRVHILPFMAHSHVGGSVAKAMDIIERHFPSTKYLYYLQHDYYFVKEVDHTALIHAMETHDSINYVFFRNEKRPLNRIKPCGEETSIEYLDNVHSNDNDNQTATTSISTKRLLLPTATYTDNNHLVRFKWYKDTIASMISLTRFPENPLQKRAMDECISGRSMGLYAYNDNHVIEHLDGRKTSFG